MERERAVSEKITRKGGLSTGHSRHREIKLNATGKKAGHVTQAEGPSTLSHTQSGLPQRLDESYQLKRSILARLVGYNGHAVRFAQPVEPSDRQRPVPAGGAR